MCPICIIDVFVRYSAEMIEGKVGRAADICMCIERGGKRNPQSGVDFMFKEINIWLSEIVYRIERPISGDK